MSRPDAMFVNHMRESMTRILTIRGRKDLDAYTMGGLMGARDEKDRTLIADLIAEVVRQHETIGV